MSTPSVAELRAVVHPPGLLDRRSGEHWAGRFYMRRLSLHATRVFLRLGWSPNQITWLMIAAGVLAGPVLLVPGLAGAVLGALLVQLYLLLDCSDGEVARWTGRTSTTGVYLDRVGHYLAEAALLAGVGFRAGSGEPNGWAVLGMAAALGAILIKAETDLVDVARARDGLTAATDASTEPRNARVGRLRRAAAALKFHRIIGAVEASLLVLLAGVVDSVAGGLTATRVLVVAFAAVAGLQLVLHLASILLSRRLT